MYDVCAVFRILAPPFAAANNMPEYLTDDLSW